MTNLASEPNTLISIPNTVDWSSYSTLLSETEQALIRLYAEVDSSLSAVDSIAALVDHNLEAASSSLKDLQSRTNSSELHLDSTFNVPLTGGQYTRLITESFRDEGIRDSASSLSREPLSLGLSPGTDLSCPARPPLEIDRITQTLRLAEEGTSEVFRGLPETTVIGGTCALDKIHGTPVKTSSGWSISCASRSPLTILEPLESWVPSTYSGGAVARLHLALNVPSPITELLISGDTNTNLLETIAAVDSRQNPLALGGNPLRALNVGWHGNLTSAGLTVTGTSRWIKAPDRDPSLYPVGSFNSSLDYALAVHGQASFVCPVHSNKHYIFRYRAFCPYANSYDTVSTPTGNPISPDCSSTHISFHVSQADALAGINPSSTEAFNDPYPSGTEYIGASNNVHVITSSKNALWVRVSLGTDPGIDFHARTANAETAYSDVWFCDEAVTRLYDLPMNSPGDGGEAEKRYVSIGNTTGKLSFSDVWLTFASDTSDLSSSTEEVSIANNRPNPPLAALPFSGVDPLLLRWEASKETNSNPNKKVGFWNQRKLPRLFRRSRTSQNALLELSSPESFNALYVYTISLNYLSLSRRSFAASGLYLTLPLGELGAGLSGEIRELGVITDPPLPSLGDRVRLWIIPDSEVLTSTDRDSPSALLARAVPLDRSRPRATFHCTAEGLAGVAPASSDVADAWATLLGQPTLHPAFSIPPSLANESSIGLPPFQSSFLLKHVPYINREAIRKVSVALTSGSALLPGVYDPNAVRPLAEIANPTGREATYAVTGYRPVTLTLTLPNGAVVRPDSLGKPRPGELVFSGKEILQEAGDVESQYLPASPNAYAFSGVNDPAVSSRARLSFNRAYLTAHSPIASGLQGASLSLFWHKSKDFDASKGGIQSSYDVALPSSDYEVDVATGHITVHAPPPGSWTEYDQIVAEYYWQVGSLAPREVFPQPDLLSLYTPFSPYMIGTAPSGSATTSLVLYKPTQSILQGYVNTATLLSDPSFTNHGQSWVSFHHNNDNIWSNAGRGSSFNPHIPSPWNYWFADNGGEGCQQHIPYPGPGGGNISCWFAYNADNHSDNYNTRVIRILLEVVQGDSGPVLESYSFLTNPAQRGTGGLPCLYGSDTDASNLTLTPPAWFPVSSSNPSAWTNFRSSLKQSSNQTVYQWPSYRMVGSGSTLSVPTTTSPASGDIDNSTIFSVVPTTRPEAPYAVRIPFQTPKAPGLQVHVTTTLVDGNNDGQGVIGFRTDLWWTTPNFTQGCIAPYVYDPVTDQCKFTPVVAGTVSSGGDAGTLKPIPSDLSDLLAGSLQQSYPVTRNITDYEGGTNSTLTPVNMDPLSPNYHPVFEYRIDSGGVPVLGDDLSDLGPYAGTKLEWAYDYLDISPRLALEILPENISALDLPDTPDPTTPCLTTPEISAFRIVINARS